MKKFTITKIYRSNEDKNGNPLKTKDGRPYERVAIQTKEMGDTWLSGFGSNRNKFWKEGDEVELEVSQTFGANGKQYNNFKEPNIIAGILREVNLLKSRVDALEGEVIKKDDDNIEEEIERTNTDLNSEEDINPEDIPF